MKQSFARKPLAILLSLLMVLSVFGGMAFTASAYDTSGSYEATVNLAEGVKADYDITYLIDGPYPIGGGGSMISGAVSVGLEGKILTRDASYHPVYTMTVGEAAKVNVSGYFETWDLDADWDADPIRVNVNSVADVIESLGEINFSATETMLYGAEPQIPVTFEAREDGIYLVANYVCDMAQFSAYAGDILDGGFSTEDIFVNVIPAGEAAVTETATEVSALIPSGVFEDDTAETVTIASETTGVTVVIDETAKAQIAETAEGDISLKVKDVTTDEEALENTKTFEITMVDSEDNEVFAPAIAEGYVTVTVPYTPAENGGDVVVYLVTNEGKVAVPCTVNANNTISFTVEHFSTYSVEQLADSVAVIESALGNKYFATFADALAEAANGETIKLLDDIALTASYTEIHKNITLDLNGKAVTGGALDIYADVTVKGPGSVTGTRHGIWVNPGAKVTVDGATINAGTGYSIYNEATTIIESGEVNGAISNSGNLTVNGGTLQTNDTTINAIGNVTLNGGTVIGTIYIYGSDDDTLDPGAYATLTVGEDATIDASATEFGIVIWHTNNKAYGVKVDIDGTVLGNVFVSGNVNQGSNAVINVNGTVDATDISGIGVAINGQATVNVNDGAYITSDGTGIEVRAGELNVTGGTIIGNGEYNFTPNGNGTTSTGCGIAIAQHTTEKDISVEISGDPVIEGTVALALANPQENDEGDLSVNVAGGTFTSTATEGDAVAVILDESENRVNGFISGGTFSSPIEEDYCAGDFVPATDPVVIDGQTYYIVKKETIVEDAAASAIVYGQALSASKVTANTNVAGTFAWATPNAKLTVAQSGSAFAVRFTPNDPAYNAVDLELAVEVIKATPSVKAPKAKNLTESKQAQELVTAGTTDFGTLVYALSTDGSAPADDAYSTAIPTAKDEGTYRVYYKVIGDENVNDVEPEFVEVEITVTHMIKALRWLVDFLQSLFNKLFPLVSGQVFG